MVREISQGFAINRPKIYRFVIDYRGKFWLS